MSWPLARCVRSPSRPFASAACCFTCSSPLDPRKSIVCDHVPPLFCMRHVECPRGRSMLHAAFGSEHFLPSCGIDAPPAAPKWRRRAPQPIRLFQQVKRQATGKKTTTTTTQTNIGRTTAATYLLPRPQHPPRRPRQKCNLGTVCAVVAQQALAPRSSCAPSAALHRVPFRSLACCAFRHCFLQRTFCRSGRHHAPT